jgi:hypothetical protein
VRLPYFLRGIMADGSRGKSAPKTPSERQTAKKQKLPKLRLES